MELKQFKLEEYEPVDYRYWVLGDDARRGVNLKRLDMITPEEIRIVDEAARFQDPRNDAGHGEFVTYFALKLLGYLPGDRPVVVPTTLTHDLAWGFEDPDEWEKKVEEAKRKGDMSTLDGEDRRLHQIRAPLLAGMVLERAGYFDNHPKKDWAEIADILVYHDTREYPTTQSGKIVWQADYLWRTTYPNLQIYHEKMGCEEALLYLEKDVFRAAPWDLGDVATQIARVEIANNLFYKFGAEAKRVLDACRPKYKKELDRVLEVYGTAS